MIKSFKHSDGFLARQARLVCDTVVPYQEKVINDMVEGCAPSHAVANFKNAAYLNKNGVMPENGEFFGFVFQDSDVAKWIEAAAYSLAIKSDKELEKRIDAICDIIAEAQESDGYLDTFFTLKRPTEKFKNLLEGHELYCAGHMMEAAVALCDVTGNDKLLRIMQKNANMLHRIFVVEGREGYPGHPEIELALMRLWRATGDDKYKELAEHFINIRGVDGEFYVKEAEKRDWKIWGNNPKNLKYQQSYAPVREQRDATGHAVRAAYLYTAMADIAAVTKDEKLTEACHALFESIISRRMYITGGIGSSRIGEAFSVDHDLPNDTAYCETCASIALIFFAAKMLKLKRDGKFADVMERALFNTVSAGVELDGTKFFYANPLEVIPGASGVAPVYIHARPQRPGWFGCACCPPNAARLFASSANYIWDVEDGVLYSNIFAAGELELDNVCISVETEYPFGDTVKYTVKKGSAKLGIHIPEFTSKDFSVSAEGKLLDGYYYVDVREGDVITVKLDMSPRINRANVRVAANSGKAAITVGPVVYCAEGADNHGEVFGFTLNGSKAPEIKKETIDEIGGFSDAARDLGEVYTVTVQGTQLIPNDPNSLYFVDEYSVKKRKIKLIPYFMWGNRGLNEMRVWLPVK
ncbi:MAG: glycoside hydrolase family 127 protein [Clostridia bacterium]|nr:glycoside hydrolase family 127 protein [Clostridia bacterium]